MKIKFKILSLFLIAFAVACGDGNKEEKEQIRLTEQEAEETVEEAVTTTAEVDNMQNKGIGPIDNLNLSEDLDPAMATQGQDLFKNLCSACHKMDKKYIGPAMAGVTERRTPEWIMNMILNPEQMIKEDPIAKKLLVESNMAIMANQNLTEEETRSILEYFRQYDQEN